MKSAMDAEQASSNMMLMKITPFIPLILRGKLLEKLNYYPAEAISVGMGLPRLRLAMTEKKSRSSQ